MDLLDTSMETSGDGEEVIGLEGSKAMLSQNLTIVEEGSLGSGEDQTVEHLSPQTLLDAANGDEVQYAIRSPEGTITYRVFQVDNGSDAAVPQFVTQPGFSNSAAQVLNNGPVYVIGNPEVLNNQSQRTIAPRSAILENPAVINANIRKVCRDEKRRATHNEVERRRRDKINHWIMKLGKIIPESASDVKGGGGGSFEGQSKGGILAKACEYISELRQTNEKCSKENEQMQLDYEDVRLQNEQLRRDNLVLKTLLTQNGIPLPKEFTRNTT